MALRHESGLACSFEALVEGLGASEEGGVIDVNVALVSLLVIASCEVVMSGFEPGGGVLADFAALVDRYAGWTMKCFLSASTSLSDLLSCQCPILDCTYYGFSLSRLLSRLISLSFRKGLGLPW